MNPPIVIQCPECGEIYLLAGIPKEPSENATRYSDGFFVDQESWRTPGIIGCVTCELGFFPEEGKIVARPDWTDVCQNWSHLKKAEPPAAGALALELRVRKKMTPETEIKIRKEFWYAGNHSEVGRLLLKNNSRFRQFWEQNLEILEQMYRQEEPAERLIKGELNRQMGQFGICLSVLTGLNSEEALAIRENALKSNREVFSFC